MRIKGQNRGLRERACCKALGGLPVFVRTRSYPYTNCVRKGGEDTTLALMRGAPFSQIFVVPPLPSAALVAQGPPGSYTAAVAKIRA